MVITDAEMPEMDGFEAASFIHQSSERNRHVPIIFLSACDDFNTFILKGYKSGAVDYMVKPANLAVLISKINVFKDLWSKNRELEEKYRELEQKSKKLEQKTALLEEQMRVNFQVRDRLYITTMITMTHHFRTPITNGFLCSIKFAGWCRYNLILCRSCLDWGP